MLAKTIHCSHFLLKLTKNRSTHITTMVYGQLHELIDQCKWDELLEAWRSNPNVFQADAREPHRDDLPLHMACERRAPVPVILTILKLHPDATKVKGRGDNLAIHVATQRNLSDELIEALIRAYPEALDEVNQANFTPQSIGHSDIETNQALRRPAACWHQLLEDEVREEEQVTRVKQLHEQVDAALERVVISDANVNGLMGRLEQVKGRLLYLESLRYETNMTKTIQKMQESLREDMETTENRLTTVEDDIKAAAAREFMAKAASRAHQSDVLRMQKRSGETAKLLRQQVERVRLEATLQESSSATSTATLPSANE
jgi:hypothetical protein